MFKGIFLILLPVTLTKENRLSPQLVNDYDVEKILI